MATSIDSQSSAIAQSAASGDTQAIAPAQETTTKRAGSPLDRVAGRETNRDGDAPSVTEASSVPVRKKARTESAAPDPHNHAHSHTPELLCAPRPPSFAPLRHAIAWPTTGQISPCDVRNLALDYNYIEALAALTETLIDDKGEYIVLDFEDIKGTGPGEGDGGTMREFGYSSIVQDGMGGRYYQSYNCQYTQDHAKPRASRCHYRRPIQLPRDHIIASFRSKIDALVKSRRQSIIVVWGGVNDISALRSIFGLSFPLLDLESPFTNLVATPGGSVRTRDGSPIIVDAQTVLMAVTGLNGSPPLLEVAYWALEAKRNRFCKPLFHNSCNDSVYTFDIYQDLEDLFMRYLRRHRPSFRPWQFGAASESKNQSSSSDSTSAAMSQTTSSASSIFSF